MSSISLCRPWTPRTNSCSTLVQLSDMAPAQRTMQHTTATRYCNTLLHYTNAIHNCMILLQHTTATHVCRTSPPRTDLRNTLLQHTTATHYCSTLLQHTTAAHYCSTLLQHTTATHCCNTLCSTWPPARSVIPSIACACTKKDFVNR